MHSPYHELQPSRFRLHPFVLLKKKKKIYYWLPLGGAIRRQGAGWAQKRPVVENGDALISLSKVHIFFTWATLCPLRDVHWCASNPLNWALAFHGLVVRGRLFLQEVINRIQIMFLTWEDVWYISITWGFLFLIYCHIMLRKGPKAIQLVFRNIFLNLLTWTHSISADIA